MDLIRSSDSKYDEYENLLFERDQLEKEANQIWTVYLNIFGKLISDGYEEKIECIKCKKIIAYYQNAINRGGSVDSDDMREFIDTEMVQYYAQLRMIIKENKDAREAGISSPYEAQRSKILYRRLVKLIHPDMNPVTDRNEVLKELWGRVLIAYRKNSVKELSELEVRVRKVLKDLGLGNVNVEIEDIEEKIEDIKEEIAEITSSEPYTLSYLVDDDEAAEKKKSELTEELENYRKYHKELNEIILKLMNGGELKFHVT